MIIYFSLKRGKKKRAQDDKLMVCTFCSVDVLKSGRFVNGRFVNGRFVNGTFCKYSRRSVNGRFFWFTVRGTCIDSSIARPVCFAYMHFCVCYAVKFIGIQNIFEQS
jgi:hypothetical protein